MAALAALAVFLIFLLGLRLRGLLPFVMAGLTWLGLLWAMRADRAPAPRAPLPEGVSRADHDAALQALGGAERDLRALAQSAPRDEAPAIRRMGDLVGAIRRHHEANPAHVARTRAFIRHTLGRMVAAVAGYVDLSRRAGPERDDRLAEVARRIEGFVPVLERIDQACVDNDLMALEVSVEVLDEQLDRDREV